jgi:hypothetical protein
MSEQRRNKRFQPASQNSAVDWTDEDYFGL